MKTEGLGFVALISIVISSQIGSGTFMLPAFLAPFGLIGIFGWIVSVSGAIALALVFARLSGRLPKNGGPHVYVSEAFGRGAGFFTAWVYWIISWSSNSFLVVTAINYLSAITGPLTKTQILTLEITFLFAVTVVNSIGVRFSSLIEIVLTVLKVIPLVLLPLVLFLFFDPSFFNMRELGDISFTDWVATVSKSALLTFWGFIGVECATTPAERVKNPKKTIPRAIIIGTSCVAFTYIANTISLTGAVGFEPLCHSMAPYSTVMQQIFGATHMDIIIAAVAIVVCVGTLNAWTLTGAQIASGAFADNLFPAFLGKTNKQGAPIAALWSATAGTVPILFLEQFVFSQQGFDTLINLLVSIFLIVYLVCCVSYIKLMRRCDGAERGVHYLKEYILVGYAILFCIFVLAENAISTTITFLIFVLLGIPVFFKNRARITKV
jgi:APA family basic amino acid/polyamine antiporter